MNPDLLSVLPRIAVIGSNNTKNAAVDPVAKQLGLPAVATLADAFKQQLHYIMVVEPYQQLYLQEIGSQTAHAQICLAATSRSLHCGWFSPEYGQTSGDKTSENSSAKHEDEGEDDEDEVEVEATTAPVRPRLGRKIWCDFLQGSLDFRRRFGENAKSPLIRAIKSGAEKDLTKLRVLDATAGLAHDAFVIAGLGAKVTLLERNIIMYSLIASGIYQGHRDVEIGKILDRMAARHADSILYLESLASPEKELERPDVIFVDPMYPNKRKSEALAKKGMYITRCVTQQQFYHVPLVYDWSF